MIPSAAVVGLVGLAGGCFDAGTTPGGDVAIGGLVPFTGVSAAGGANYERAMLLAAEYLNRREQQPSRRFRVAVRDSHSTAAWTLEGLRALRDQNIVGLLGPEQVELVQKVRTELAGQPISHLSPNSITLADFAGDRAGLLVRPAPAAEYVGCALANRIYGDGQKKLVVLHAPDAYRQAFAAAVVRAFESYRFAAHVGVGRAILLPDAGDALLDAVREASAFQPETVVVAADVTAAAQLVSAWTSVGAAPVKWFFDPALRSQEFLRNVNHLSVAGALGISIALPDQAEEFVQVFKDRWQGEEPLVESHLYFDSTVAVGLAALVAEHQVGRTATAAEVSDRLLQVLRGPGQSVGWNELERVPDLIAAGQSLRYVGVAGRWTIDGKGLSDATAGLFRFWRIEGATIVAENFGACPAGTIPPDGRP